jgi:hypothetical protein
MDKLGETITGIVAAIITVTIVALIVSQGSTSVGVLTSFFQGLTGLLGVAISPVTGTTSQFANTGLQSSGLINDGSLSGFTTANGGVNLNLGGLGNLGNLGNLASLGGGSNSIVDNGSFDSGSNVGVVNDGGLGSGFVDTGSF